MWSTLFRGFGGWIAKNWAGLAAGYALSDVASGVTSGVTGQRNGDLLAEPVQPKSKIVQWMQKTFGVQIPVWVYGLLTAIILFYIYRILEKFKK